MRNILSLLKIMNRKISTNKNCHKGKYPGSDTFRFEVPTDLVPWETEFKDYDPVEYTAPVVNGNPPWADVDIKKNPEKKLKFNEKDGGVDRRSFIKKYEVIDGIPRNPIGRTGMCGRGLLGRWGPNHAADPIVTRWKKVNNQMVKGKDEKNILQFISIQRRDNGDWALPGGMVDAGEVVSTTLKREFSEETLDIDNLSDGEKAKMVNKLNEIFKHGTKVYEGYSDDVRNTDNAWIETVAMNFHDEKGNFVGGLKLNAGDDAGRVQWMDISKDLQLYANHVDFLYAVVKLRNASW